MSENIINLKNLTVAVEENNKEKLIIKNISLDICKSDIVALVGGSGSGKTTTGLSILRLLPAGLKIKSGEIVFNKNNLLFLKEKKMIQVRGSEISMIFQEPLEAFNPVFSIGYQIEEVLRLHTNLSKKQRQKEILNLLDIVGIKDPNRVSINYPHQLSGGMRQRAMIAQAIAAKPKLVIADEPTSNLDVTIQAKIIELFRELKDKLDLSILLITHDLIMVSHIADKVAVMTDGKIVECGEVDDILRNPQHVYTKTLMDALS